MNVLIIGKSGLLKTKCHEYLIDRYRVGGISKSGAGKNNKKVDVTDKKAVDQFFKQYSFDVVIHAAGLTDVDYCEQHRDEAWESNVEATKNVVLKCKEEGAKLIYISSNQIYDGEEPPYSEQSEPKPVNYFGITKLEAERFIREELREFAIIRPGKLYGFSEETGCDTLVTSVRKQLSEGNPVTASQDTIYTPTLVDDVVALIALIIGDDLEGRFNICGGETVSEYQFVEAICETYGLDSEKVHISQQESEADLYANSNYTLKKINSLGISPRKLRDGLSVMYKQEFCTFRPIYKMGLTDEFNGQSSSSIRHSLGAELAKSDPVTPDIVVPIPRSGVYPAVGYANEANIPMKFGISKHELRRQTLYDMTVDRSELLDEKMRVIPEVIADQNIVLVDEAILSGTTIKSIVSKLQAAESVHIRVSSPPITQECPAGIHPTNINLYADGLIDSTSSTQDELERRMEANFGVDSVRFVDKSRYVEIVAGDTGICSACFHETGRNETPEKP